MSRLLERYGSWAVITGASEGIGRELAMRAAAGGLSVVLVARRADALRALAEDLETHYGATSRIIAADLGTDAGVARVLEETEALDVGLFAASAGFGTSGAFLSSPIAEELAMLDVNCRAVLALTHAFAKRFVARRRGGIVLMSSIVAFQGVPFAAGYAATKAWVQSLAEALHVELRPHGVDVIASAPGPVHSGFAARARMEMGLALRPVDVAQRTLDALGRSMTVRPGWLSKLLEAALKVPRWARVRIMKRVMGGMTRHQVGMTTISAKGALEGSRG
jgi:hypothetical protein